MAESMRAEIERSWQRVRIAGLARDQPVRRLEIADVDTRSRFMVAARPVLEDMAEQLTGTRFCLVAADSACHITYRWFDNPKVERALDEVSAVTGARYSEDQVGTNAPGTALETGHGVVVHGEEHYKVALQRFSCYAQPVRPPVSRRIEGVVDIPGITADANPLLAPFLQRAVRDIEQQLFEEASATEQRLLLAYRSAARTRSKPAAVLGGDTVLANTAAIELLDTADHGLLRVLAAQAPLRTSCVLASGTRVAMHVDRIPGTVDGALFQFDRLASDRPSAPSEVPVSSLAGPDWAELRNAGLAVHVAGEPGTGRTTALRALAGERPFHVLNAADVVVWGERAWAARLAELAAQPGAVVAVEEIQLLPEPLTVALSTLLGESGGARLLLSSGPRDELNQQVANLAARCPEQVELPPLRDRFAEFGELVRSMLATLRADADLRFTPSALEALVSQPWPGNLRELAVVLRQVTDKRSAGDVTVDDLPPGYRVSSRASRLAGRDRAEYAAIVAALQTTGGNKARAAERLGISRTTLYNRMRALGIAG
ncbi:helix-turn-helix domain-containing protein [Haloechinothrix sp. LS1_15]|uniref:sigma-54-dependent Fis family transcriptional regulator n=1 Tax=Haloechinothrix sp. LS1_15 TaxID=2652248 RepID=UPI00294AB133|nr:helix-turn-helix domain-containing protein [Haloechinothrix sp. LS1_15]